MWKFLSLLLVVAGVLCQPIQDRVDPVPVRN